MVTAFVVWWPAGLGMLVLATVLVVALRRPTQRIGPTRMFEEEAWSDLAAVMEEAIHGQDDVRTSLARPYVLRLYAQRASEVLRRGRRVWALGAWVTASAVGVMRLGIALVGRRRRVGADVRAASTAPSSPRSGCSSSGTPARSST